MQKAKTKQEIVNQFYFSKSDLKKLLSVSWKTACRIYELADQIDNDLTYRIEDTKVSVNSVCKVMGMTYDQIKKRYC